MSEEELIVCKLIVESFEVNEKDNTGDFVVTGKHLSKVKITDVILLPNESTAAVIEIKGNKIRAALHNVKKTWGVIKMGTEIGVYFSVQP